VVHQGFVFQTAQDTRVFTNAVEYNNLVLHRETDYGQQRGQEERVDLPVEEQGAEAGDAEDHGHIMHHGNDRADTIAEGIRNFPESERDVDHHGQRCHGYRQRRT
jgi:hypothetical protein